MLACALAASAAMTANAAPLLATPANAAGQAGDRYADQTLKPGQSRAAGAEVASETGPGFTRLLLSLAGVIVLIIATGWLYRRLFGRQQDGRGAIALVSRTLLTPRHQVLLVRAGRRLLVVGDSGQGMNLLCQISDPDEIADLLEEGVTTRAREGSVEAAVDHKVGEPLPGADFPPLEVPPSLDAARGEIRALIERVRGLGTARSREHPATETAR
jgi:flagellar biogenesis protein FliO